VHNWNIFGARTKHGQTRTNSQDSPRFKLGRSHHLPLYNILCAWPWGQHPNVILSRDSQLGNPKIPKIGILITLETHFFVNLRMKWGLKQSYNPRWDLFNDMSHFTCTQINQNDFWFLMVESQIGNLTPGPSFGHNLCFKHSNGSCKPISDIYVPRYFQWYK
jgi:hypothetical protein